MLIPPNYSSFLFIKLFISFFIPLGWALASSDCAAISSLPLGWVLSSSSPDSLSALSPGLSPASVSWLPEGPGLLPDVGPSSSGSLGSLPP